MLQDEQIARWKTLLNEMSSNGEFLNQHRAREIERHDAVREMYDLLTKYLNGNIENAEFRSTYQQKTGTDWVSFGLGGFSGAMFLNMLVNNIPDQKELGQYLKTTLPVPLDIEDGYQRLTTFMDYLRALLKSGVVPKGKIQAGHAPFFFSSWWHIQNIQEWPIYYRSARKALESEGVYSPLYDQPIDDYFAFRDVFLLLSGKLGITPWDMEHLCVWREERGVAITPPIDSAEVVSGRLQDLETGTQLPSTVKNEEERTHTHVQWLLARIGQTFGYKIWIAANDRRNTWNREALGKYSVDALSPFNGVEAKSQRMIELIDLLWLQGHRIVAAFEVESTTSIYSGLLRMSDLTLALPNFNLPLYIVVPSIRVENVKAQLSRLTFQHLELHKRCSFFTFENLVEEAEPMMKYARDISAIDRISQRVGEINENIY